MRRYCAARCIFATPEGLGIGAAYDLQSRLSSANHAAATIPLGRVVTARHEGLPAKSVVMGALPHVADPLGSMLLDRRAPQ
jgi:hypothetical protein